MSPGFDTSLTSLILGVELNYVTGERMYLGVVLPWLGMYPCVHTHGQGSSYANKGLSVVGMYPSKGLVKRSSNPDKCSGDYQAELQEG